MGTLKVGVLLLPHSCHNGKRHPFCPTWSPLNGLDYGSHKPQVSGCLVTNTFGSLEEEACDVTELRQETWRKGFSLLSDSHHSYRVECNKEAHGLQCWYSK